MTNEQRTLIIKQLATNIIYRFYNKYNLEYYSIWNLCFNEVITNYKPIKMKPLSFIKHLNEILDKYKSLVNIFNNFKLKQEYTSHLEIFNHIKQLEMANIDKVIMFNNLCLANNLAPISQINFDKEFNIQNYQAEIDDYNFILTCVVK